MDKLTGKRKKRKKSVNPWVRQLKLIGSVSAIFLCILLYLLYRYDPLVPGTKETGKIANVFNTQTRYGSGTRYVIELESGDIVNVNASRMGPYKKGRLVIVERMDSKIFNKKVYRFIRYKN